jgi:hypothetical protein
VRSKIHSFRNSFLNCQKPVALAIGILYNENIEKSDLPATGADLLIPGAMWRGRTIIDIRDWSEERRKTKEKWKVEGGVKSDE